MAEIIDVLASTHYKVHIGSGLLSAAGNIIRELKAPCRAAIITDKTVDGLHGSALRTSLEDAGFTCVTYAFTPGEKSKTMSTLADILEFLAENRITRSDLIVAFGGGVPGDIGGFAAGIYMRGIPFVQIPTTLLSAVDSSVGGKTAVDLRFGKNLAGLFNQPICVICDTDTLKTLSNEDFSCGMAETIKYGVLTDSKLFDKLAQLGCRKNLESGLESVISRCVLIKSNYVNRDEFDTGDRQFLNLGHTVGHAIEKCSGYTVPHGFAVAIGLAVISRASEKYGITSEPVYEKLCSVLRAYGLPIKTDFPTEQLIAAAGSDKKVAKNHITLVLPEKIGMCTLKTSDMELLSKMFRLGLE